MVRPAAAVALAALSCAAQRARPAPLFDPARAAAEVAWLADPARTGRGVGTPGDAEAAGWIAARFAEAGLVPAGERGWLQPFDAPVRAVLRPGNALRIGGEDPILAEGWQPFAFSDDGSAEGELVWAGYGITAPELARDDYAGLDVRGKVVLVAQDYPGEQDPRSPFRSPRHYRLGEWRTKIANARAHGAAAVLGVRDGWQHPGADALTAWKGTISSRAGLVAARVTERALRAAGIDAAALAREPAGRPLGIGVLVTVRIEQERAPTSNVVALLRGADPAVADECVVVGAHYDHLGLGGEESLAPELTGTVHPGADDNASGVSALLAVARASAAGPPPRRSLLFVAFGAEEIGLLGSSRLAASPPAACPLDRMQLMVNLDMVGRPDRGRLYVDGAGSAPGLRALVSGAEARAGGGISVVFGAGDSYGPSDHTSFRARGVPALYLFTGAHPDYHRPSDTADRIDAPGLAAVARLAAGVVAAAADAPARLGR
jgi:hypothetical protein